MDTDQCSSIYLSIHSCEVHDILRRVPKTNSEWVRDSEWTSHCSIWDLSVDLVEMFFKKNSDEYPNIWHAYCDMRKYENNRQEPSRERSIPMFYNRKQKRKRRFIYILLISISMWLKTGNDFITDMRDEFENFNNSGYYNRPIKIENWQDRDRQKGRSVGRNKDIGLNLDTLTPTYYRIHDLINNFATLVTEKLSAKYECNCQKNIDIDSVISKINFEKLVLDSKSDYPESNIALIKHFLTEKLKSPLSWKDFSNIFNKNMMKVFLYNRKTFELTTNDNLIAKIREHFMKTSDGRVCLSPDMDSFSAATPRILICYGDDVPSLNTIDRPTNICFICDEVRKSTTIIEYYNGKFIKKIQEAQFGKLCSCTSCILLSLPCISMNNKLDRSYFSNPCTIEHDSGFSTLFSNSYSVIRNCYKIYLILRGMDNIKCAFNEFNRNIVSYILQYVYAISQKKN